MSTILNANVNDRDTVKAVYPLSAYEADVNENSIARATVRHGVRIETAPDATGAFRVARASQSVAATSETGPDETEPDFLCPHMGREYGRFALRGGQRGAVEEKQDIFQDHTADEYELFIDKVIEAARRTELLSPLHRHRMPRG
jgi:hypothetical protein